MPHYPRSLFEKAYAFLRNHTLLYPLAGFAALVWFLIRVIPKPSRALYPCQKVATPMASGFVAWILASSTGLMPSIFAFKKGARHYRNARFASAAAFFAIAMLCYGGFVAMQSSSDPAIADNEPFVPETANEPIGTGIGINPGRVAWVHDPDAANYVYTGYWWEDTETNQEVVNEMMDNAVQWLTGKESNESAWDALFRYFNNTHDRGDVGYTPGEKIAIKVNMNNSDSGTWTAIATKNKINSSPQTIYALVSQLIEDAGVAGADITVYDASRGIGTPVVHKIRGNTGQDYQDVRFVVSPQYPGLDLTTAVHDESIPVVFADTTMQDYNTTYLPACVTEATYLVDLGLLKGHSLAGVTFCAKNFFGSLYRPSCIYQSTLGWTPNGTDQGADGMYGIHYYMNPFQTSFWNKTSWVPKGNYNALVDLMGHEHLGGKVVLFLVEGLYSSADQGGDMVKFTSPPFNGDWTSSIFASQDMVALESVCMDFLLTESSMTYNKGALDNYLHEAALANDPPSGTFYDPEGDGTRLASLGVHEHWNNAEDKQYSRNLGTGGGIELVSGPYVGDAPTVPENLTVEIASGEVTLAWDSCGDDVEYTVKRSETSNYGYEIIAGGITECRYIDTEVTDLHTYYYVVAASNEWGESDISDEISAVPHELPSIPANLQVEEVDSTKVTLTWDSCGDDMTYKVQRSETSGGDYETIASRISECTYTDTLVTAGVPYYYVVIAVNRYKEESDCSEEISAIPQNPTSINEQPTPFELSLSNNPNPFNASTRISFTLPEESNVRLDIYNVVGQRVATLANTRFNAGNHGLIWSGRDDSGEKVSGGIYLVHLRTDSASITRKITLLY